MSRRIQRLLTRRNQLKKNFQPKRNGAKPEVDLSKIQCYGCNQFGHYKNDCPKNKQKKPFFKKKSMMATWDDLEEAQSEDEEQEANVCLMTRSNAEEECLLAVKKRPRYLDSGCSRHMTGDRNSFLSFETREGGSVTFRNNEKASIKDQSTVHTADDEEEEPVIVQNHDSDENPTSQGPPKTWRIVGYHPPDQIIGNTEDGVRTRKALQDVETNLGLISQIEPRSINEAIIDESWIKAMKEELHQFEKNEVWNLVPFPKDNSIIGTRWVFRNKLDENGKVVRNKARLVAQEIDEFELEPVTSTKSEPVKTKKSPTPKKKDVKTAVKVPKTKKKIAVKKSKEKLLPAPLIQPEDEEIFQKYWMTKPVAVSKLYNFAELSSGGVDLEKFVEPFEWKSFFHIKETVYPLLVQAFYYNAQVFPDKDMITSNIKDVELVVDPYVIGSLIGIKSEGLEVYGNDWYDQVKISKEELKRKMFTEEGAKKNSPSSSMLKTEYKLLHNMCQHSFFPRTGSKDKVTDLDLLMLYHMAKGVKLNLPYIILHHMIHVATSGYKKIALPYAMLLTRVFRLYYADMNNTISENNYYTFSLKNVHHMKKDVETPAVDVGSKRKRDDFEKTNLNVLADVSGDQLENDLQTSEQTQISGDVDPTTECDKLVTTAATTLQGFKPVSAPQNTTMFSPLMTSSQGSLSSFCTSEFIRNILTSDTPEISTIPIPKPTDSTLPSIPSSFDSFCSSVNATNAGTQQLHSMMNHLLLESKTLRDWFTTVVCPQLHIPPPPEIETPQFDSFPVTNDKSDDDCPTTSTAPDGANV
ncbi:hypothetical protein TSUD_146980 [Trifolium subterraneum]|uniref:CCHC-type domain-containing protein n=1 Tax=Trifolium subterraneum TaxID=3900 RepID=A0A2Z6MIZ5_TRISU|nr:hypothetical protein TSUD_146980 [Trifolium subterraneum]